MITHDTLPTCETPRPAALSGATAPQPRTVPRYRERGFGVGYGASSGYASQRIYCNGRRGTDHNGR